MGRIITEGGKIKPATPMPATASAPSAPIEKTKLLRKFRDAGGN